MRSKWYAGTCDECNRKTDYIVLACVLDIPTYVRLGKEAARFLFCPRSSDTLVLSILAERRQAVWQR